MHFTSTLQGDRFTEWKNYIALNSKKMMMMIMMIAAMMMVMMMMMMMTSDESADNDVECFRENSEKEKRARHPM